MNPTRGSAILLRCKRRNTRNDFDFIAIFSPGTFGFTMSERQFEGMFGNATQFFCDGAGIDYRLHLKGHRRLYSDEDACNMTVTS